MQNSMLTTGQSQLLRDEKGTLSNILIKLADLDVSKDSINKLQNSILQLDELFLIVVVGEFNAGKSALINAMLREKILSEGVTPTTSRVTLVRWGEQVSTQVIDDGFAIMTHPLDLLKQLNIVDSPGTNAIIQQHERLTNEFVPRSDIVLFTTSADRPLTESEHKFLQKILAWGKKVVFVLNKTDIFEDEKTLKEAVDYVTNHAASVLGEVPILFPVSARVAQRSMAEMDEVARLSLFKDSRLGDLEDYIRSTLDDSGKLRLKFNNPLGVADKILQQAGQSIDGQYEEIIVDINTVKSLETAVSGYRKELDQELSPRLAEIENILHKLEFRGNDFFDRTFRITNIHHLAKGDRIRAAFEKEVVTDLSAQIDTQIHSLIEWLIDKDLREWQQVMSFLQRRKSANLDRIVSGTSSPAQSRRQELFENVGKSVKKIVDTYDQRREAKELAANVESAVAQTALFEAGAVGLGALVATAVLSSSFDVTGILAAGTLAVLGLFVIPYKRKQAKESFSEKIKKLRTNLNEALKTVFTRETDNAILRMNENIGPYAHFVETEAARIDRLRQSLEEMRKELSIMRSRVDDELK
ncbi:MAG: GTP-binding protein [Leptolinea sp.]|nr:GTP-binding protein [Leptolinea sp.]